MKNQKGITLIALVITIIVLLILAGVAIAMLSGDNGILTKAKDSSVQNALGSAREKCGLIANEEITKYYETVYVNATTSTEFDNDALDTQVKTAITTNTIGVEGITATWGTDEGKTKELTLTYTDGTTAVGDLASGKISWK